MYLFLRSAFIVGLACMTAQAADPYEQRVLHSFEDSPDGWSGGEVGAADADAGATEGDRAYHVTFTKAGQGIHWTGERDLSGWDKIKLDTYNPGDSYNVSMIFRDADGATYRVWYQLIMPGRSQLEYNLRGLVSQVPEADGQVQALDLTRITSMRLVIEGVPANGATAMIDNIRLTRGPEPAVAMEQFRPAGADRQAEHVPGNLVANGDFQLSLQHWNSWGQWDGGIYRFGTVSGEKAYTGGGAAAITAQRVGRGGIFQMVTIPEAGAYNFSFAYRGEDGADAMRYELPNGPTRNLKVTDQWQVHERQVELPEGEAQLYLHHVSGGQLHLDDVRLVPADPDLVKRIEAQRRPADTTTGEANEVTIEGARVFVNGEPIFPIGFWQVDDPAVLQDAGVNFNHWAELDPLHEAGMLGTADTTKVLRGYRPDLIADANRPHQSHPGLFGWYLIDEPDHARWNVPPHVVRAAHQTMRRVSELPTIVVLMAWQRGPAYQYNDAADILVMLPYTPNDTERVIRATRWLRDRDEHPKPSWIGLHSGWEPNEPVPDRADAFVQAYAAIANGATGLFWFSMNWSHANQPERFQSYLDLTSELGDIHDVLAAADADQQPKASHDAVHLLLKDAPDGPVLIAVNVTGADAQDVRITLPEGVDAATARSIFDDRELELDGRVLVDTFKARERHVYELVP